LIAYASGNAGGMLLGWGSIGLSGLADCSAELAVYTVFDNFPWHECIAFEEGRRQSATQYRYR
jgi:hypothetical protein